MRLHRFVLQVFSCAVPFAVLTGCGGSGGSTGSAPVIPTAPSTPALTASNSFYLTQSPVAIFPETEAPEILQFSRTANGTVAPGATIAGSIGSTFNAVTVDSAGNLYAGGPVFSGSTQAGSQIAEYAANASGKATPIRTITSGLNSLITTSISSMAVDSENNLYVATDVTVGSGAAGRVFSGIVVYSSTSSSPTRTIAGDATRMFSASQIAVDSANNIYVANAAPIGAGSLLVFDAAATGNAAPKATISGDATTIYNTRGVAVDAAGNIYVSTLAYNPPPAAAFGGTSSIVVFPSGANGNVAPTTTISGAATALGAVGNLRLDSTGAIYALGGAFESGTVLKFAAGASGNAAPESSVTPASMLGIAGTEIAVQ